MSIYVGFGSFSTVSAEFVGWLMSARAKSAEAKDRGQARADSER